MGDTDSIATKALKIAGSYAALFLGAGSLQLSLLALHVLVRPHALDSNAGSGGPGWGTGAGYALMMLIFGWAAAIFGLIALVLLGCAIWLTYRRLKIKLGPKKARTRLGIALALFVLAPSTVNLLGLAWGLVADTIR